MLLDSIPFPLLVEFDPWQIVDKGGTIGVLALLIYAIAKGILRTSHEVIAWKDRAIRSETQVDTLVPAIDRLTNAVERRERERGMTP